MLFLQTFRPVGGSLGSSENIFSKLDWREKRVEKARNISNIDGYLS
ncbi:hypothetical protein JT359_09300 [Candidatus Poribacteria bacterium]|nr:hypothetical protein [Candidatus Poribacteria bacterium]